ncbi:hypothetical protein ACHAWF_007572 [Thalassiosira exigua]
MCALDERCRTSKVCFVNALCTGVFGTVFYDFGESFVVSDKDGEKPAMSQVENILCSNPVVVKVLEGQGRYGLETGSCTTLSKVRGLSACWRTGTPSTSYQVVLESPGELMMSDFAKFDCPPLLHLAYRALAAYAEAHDMEYPKPGDMAAAKEVWDLAKSMDKDGNLNGNTAVLKACSGKFTPINGFFYLDADECLPDAPLPAKELAPTGSSRYDSGVAAFGWEAQKKLLDLNYFPAREGTIGCEMLNNWGLMGVACGPNGAVHITDMDRIEKSNLSRQFLFRNGDIDAFKSSTAARAAVEMNPDMHVTPYQEKVGSDTEHVFGDDFYDKLDGVCTALDNVEARLYVDQRCLFYRLPLLESGTLGTKGNTQVVVPNVTENYGATRDPPEKSIPVCTPGRAAEFQVGDCDGDPEDASGRAACELRGLRGVGPAEVREIVQQPDTTAASQLPGGSGDVERDKVLVRVSDGPLRALLRLPRALLRERGTGVLELVLCMAQLRALRWSMLAALNDVTRKPKRGLSPSKGVTSWKSDVIESRCCGEFLSLTSSLILLCTIYYSSSKRCPKAQVFDLNDKCEDAQMRNHFDFIVAAANLRAHMFGIKGRTDEEYFAEVLQNVIVPDFTPQEGVKIASTEAEAKESENAASAPAPMDESTEVEQILASLPQPGELAGFKLNPVEFDKDLDDHMLFVTACSNLRALNYSIPTEDTHRSRAIAGRIIPAIATTTALVTGLICFELYKIAGTSKKELKIDAYKNGFVNLAIPFMTLSEPTPPAATKAVVKGKEWNWTAWDSLDMSMGDITLQEFISFFETEYNLDVSMISHGVSILFSFFANKKKLAERMKMKMSEVVESVTKKELPPNQLFLIFEIIANDLDTDEEVELPYVKFRFR